MELYRLATQPAARPVRRPLPVDPMTIESIWARTSGVNHAVSPSRQPEHGADDQAQDDF